MPRGEPRTLVVMPRPVPYVPDDPLRRFLELARDVRAQKSWHQGWTQLRYAIAGLLTVPGPGERVVEQMFQAADQLRSGARWFDALREDIRFCVAAALLRSGLSTRDYLAELERGRALFRAAKLGGRSGATTVLAVLILVEHGEGRIDEQRVKRLASLYATLRRSHPLLTGQDDYPTCALLAVADDEPAHVVNARLERLYEGLKDLRFRRGNQLQLATHLLYFCSWPDEEALARFRALYAGFGSEGLWMHRDDYDEIAVLSFLGASPADVVREVLAHRARLADLRPRPSKQERFTLACNTAFVALAARDDLGRPAHDAARLTLLHGLLQAQQAAIAAAAAGAASAAVITGGSG